MKTSHRSISVVIPVFNGEKTIGELVDRLVPVLRKMTKTYEVIFINDGSRDGSWMAIRDLAEKYPFLRGIDLMRNYGQHNALLVGIRAAKHDIIVTMDDDLQHPPEEIPSLLSKLDEGYDVVYGIPQQQQHGFWRNISSKATKLALQSAVGYEVARNISAFRALRTRLREAFKDYQGSFVSIDILLTWGTSRFSPVTVRHEPRREGASNYSVYRLIVLAMNMVTGFSSLPLQAASILGFASTVFGLFILVFVIARYLILGGAPAGFPFLASIIAIFSGIQLFAIGIMGEYLARVHFRLMDKPPYAVRSDTSEMKQNSG